MELDQYNGDGVTPLFIAAAKGHRKIVQFLLQYGADPDMRTSTNNSYPGRTPLMISAYYGHLDAARQLIAAGADVSLQRKDGMDALYYASWKGHLSIVQDILRKNPDIADRRTYNGWTSFTTAARKGHLEICRYLNNAYAINIDASDSSGKSPLIWAADSNEHAIVEYLLQNNANIFHKDNWGYDALDLAKIHNNVKIVKMLEKLY